MAKVENKGCPGICTLYSHKKVLYEGDKHKSGRSNRKKGAAIDIDKPCKLIHDRDESRKRLCRPYVSAKRYVL